MSMLSDYLRKQPIQLTRLNSVDEHSDEEEDIPTEAKPYKQNNK